MSSKIIADLAEGASKGLFSGIGQFFKDVRTAITGVDPIKRAELEMKLAELEGKAQELELQSKKITVEDRNSARNREIEARKSGSKEIYPMLLDIVAVIAFVGCLYALFNKVMPEGTAKDILLLLLGTLAAIVKDIYGYWRGSSSGSSEKTTAMADVLRAIGAKKD